MPHPSDVKTGLTLLEAEIHQERSGALGRIGGVLEGDLAELERLGAALDALPAPSADERAALLFRFAETRAHAELYFWYLLVQREAIGMREHSVLYLTYPIPPPRRA